MGERGARSLERRGILPAEEGRAQAPAERYSEGRRGVGNGLRARSRRGRAGKPVLTPERASLRRRKPKEGGDSRGVTVTPPGLNRTPPEAKAWKPASANDIPGCSSRFGMELKETASRGGPAEMRDHSGARKNFEGENPEGVSPVKDPGRAGRGARRQEGEKP
jgi:hypothetical protein